MNLANKITFFRIFLIPVFLIVYLNSGFGYAGNFVAAGIFVLASLTDWLDGYIARSRNMVTNLGKLLDPLADKLLVASALIALIEVSFLPAWVVIVLIGREFVVTGFRLVAIERGKILAAGNLGKLKTATQMLMVTFLLLGLSGKVIDLLGWLLIALSLIFSVVSAIEYITANVDVLKEDTNNKPEAR